MVKLINEYNIIWIDKDKEQTDDDVCHYNSDEALDIIFKDKYWDDKTSEILWMGKRPLTRSQMRERKAITGINVT